MSVRRLAALTTALAISGGALAVPLAAHATSEGSVSVSLTKPVVSEHTRQEPVACTADGSVYRAVLAGTDGNYQVAITDVVGDYTGSGEYESTAAVAVRYLPTGSVATATRQVKVQIDDSNETATVPFSVTLPGTYVHRLAGRGAAGSISWQCES